MANQDEVRAEIRDFPTTRRAKVTPDQGGLPAYGGNRRVPGLRREEVAMLAGVSVDYYIRLERGNLSGVSGSVLESLARALQLDGPRARTSSTWPKRPTPPLAWFRGAQVRHEGHLSAAGVDKDVAFVDVGADPADTVNDDLDAAYRSKYRRYPRPHHQPAGAVNHAAADTC